MISSAHLCLYLQIGPCPSGLPIKMLFIFNLPWLLYVLPISYSFHLVKGKSILVTGRGAPQACEMSRLPHFLDNRLKDGGEAVCQPYTLAAPYPQEYSCYSFLLEAESTQGHNAAGRIRSSEKSNGLIGNQTHDLPACSIVPQPPTLLHDPLSIW
jgi:hypothetical protein